MTTPNSLTCHLVIFPPLLCSAPFLMIVKFRPPVHYSNFMCRLATVIQPVERGCFGRGGDSCPLGEVVARNSSGRLRVVGSLRRRMLSASLCAAPGEWDRATAGGRAWLRAASAASRCASERDEKAKPGGKEARPRPARGFPLLVHCLSVGAPPRPSPPHQHPPPPLTRRGCFASVRVFK